MREAEVDVAEDVKEILPQKMFCYYTSFLFTKDVSLYDQYTIRKWKRKNHVIVYFIASRSNIYIAK